MAYEMGMTGLEIEACTLREFNLRLTGYHRRQEREWDRTRHIMSFILNYSGWGAKDFQHPKDIYPLGIDQEHGIKYITTHKQAMALLKEFEEWPGLNTKSPETYQDLQAQLTR